VSVILLSTNSRQEDWRINQGFRYHTKLQKFIKNEQDNASNPIRARVSNTGESVHIRGPSSVVDWLAAKCLEFVEQEKQDEKERGFVLEFEFPQKFANHLIGKGGSNIRELREKFDVEIQVNDGKVQLTGPKAKAEAAKTHINGLARQLQDEATHVLKIDPKFHREIIGAQGNQVNKLQTRYKVLVFFPRNNTKNAKDDESLADSASDAGKGRRQQAPDEVIIRGPKRGADEARDELLSLLQYLKDTSFSATVTVQKKQVPSLIGSGGAVLEQLRQSTGAKIDVPSAKESAEDQVDIQIKGTKTQVAAAKKILEEKKAIFDDTVVKKIEVPRKYHRALIGTGGKSGIPRRLQNMLANRSQALPSATSLSRLAVLRTSEKWRAPSSSPSRTPTAIPSRWRVVAKSWTRSSPGSRPWLLSARARSPTRWMCLSRSTGPLSAVAARPSGRSRSSSRSPSTFPARAAATPA
jgi:transcription antitermination factor NusA-like protein